MSLHTRRTFGINDDIDYGAMAADAFGNSLGNAVVSWSVATTVGAPIREPIDVERDDLSAGEMETASPRFAAPSLQQEPISRDTKRTNATEQATTLETVRVVGRPYGYGWYFYRQDSWTNSWVDMQRPVRSAPAHSGEKPSLWNSYGAAAHRAPWKMPETSTTPYQLPRHVAVLGAQPRQVNGSGLKPSDLPAIEHLYTQAGEGEFTKSFHIANELAFDSGSTVLDRGVGVVGGTFLFVPWLLEEITRGAFNSVDDANVAGQIMAQGHALGTGYEAEYTQRAALTFLNAALSAIDVVGISGVGRKTLTVGFPERFAVLETRAERVAADLERLNSGEGPHFLDLREGPDIDAQQRLNTPDLAKGKDKFSPGEASMAAEFEKHFGIVMRRAEYLPENLHDFDVLSGPLSGKKIDFMVTPDSFLAAKKLNENFELNLRRGLEGNVMDHLEKADFLPMGTRLLTPRNNELLLNLVFGLSPESRAESILVR